MLDQLLTYLKAHSGDGGLAPWLAAVGLGTVIASVVAGWVALTTSRRTVQTEFHKAQIGAQQKMHELLVAARLAVYGELSGRITHLWKDPPPVGAEVPVLDLLLTNLDAWDVKYGMLLGPETTNDFHDFRWLLHDVLEDLRAGKVNESNYAAVRQSVHRAGMQLELGLRSDIGVYGVGISQKEKALAMTRRTSWYERPGPGYSQRFAGWFQGRLRHHRVVVQDVPAPEDGPRG